MFVFGGVGPDDVVRGYVVLLVTAIGFGSVGLFFSALIRRTQAATVLTYVDRPGGDPRRASSCGASGCRWRNRSSRPPRTDDTGLQAAPRRAPEALLWLNPFVAQADVICGTETSSGATCSIISEVTGRTVVFGGGTTVPLPVPDVPVTRVGSGEPSR